MTHDTVRIPSVAATVRRYLFRSLLGERIGWSSLLIWVPFAAVLVLAVPRLDSFGNEPLMYLAIFGPIGAALEARREYVFGGPARLVVAAGLSAFVGLVACAALFYAASITFGPEPGFAPIDALRSLPSDVFTVALLGLGVLLVIRYWMTKSARAREDAEFLALVRAERLARGKPPRGRDQAPFPEEKQGPVTIL